MRVINENQIKNIKESIQWILLNKYERIFRINVYLSIFAELNLASS
jgi:hypothetical protein